MPSTWHHVVLAPYADNTAIIDTSHKPTLLVSYMELYLIEHQRRLSKWRIATKFFKSAATISRMSDPATSIPDQ